MNFTYNQNSGKYILGQTEYTQDEFIAYIQSGLLREALANKSSFDISADQEDEFDDDDDFIPKHDQIIYYGVPGCGKSNKIKNDLANISENNVIRVVFHPEYTNADFVGQILPVTQGGIHYEFTAGPFSQILKKAYLNPKQNFYLVIEEINRGNAAAIFGDMFQLLDRLKKDEKNFKVGWSQYFVQNRDVNEYIRKASRTDYGTFIDSQDDEQPVIAIGNTAFDKDSAIRLPPNLSILATMNTSDQNVFTLDNAFQRRFDMQLIRNEFETFTNLDQQEVFASEKIRMQHDATIGDTEVSWGKFWKWINKKITQELKGLSSTEDKRLGVWFVCNENGVISTNTFADKVLKYLWDDAFKFKRNKIFAANIDTLEELVKTFKNADWNARFDVFSDHSELI